MEYNVHDNRFVEARIRRTPDSIYFDLDMLEYGTDKKITYSFVDIDWINSNFIGILAHEGSIYSISELSWNEVPELYAVNPASMNFYKVIFSGGSEISIVAHSIIINLNRNII